MSFYLIGKPLLIKQIPQKMKVVFARAIRLQSNLEILVLIGYQGQLLIIDIKNGQRLYDCHLKCNDEPLGIVLTVQYHHETICIMSCKNIYLLILAPYLQAIRKKHPPTSLIKIDKLEFGRNSTAKKYHFEKMTNKKIKIVQYNGNLCLKIIGRIEKTVFYYFGTLDVHRFQMVVNLEYSHHLQYEYSFNLQSLGPDLVFYLSYVNKSKPIKLIVVEFLTHSETANKSELIQQVDILNLHEQLTIVSAFKLNDGLLCIIANNSFQDQKTSIMVVYQIKEKYTRNYLELKDELITKIFFFPTPNYQFNSLNCKISLDAISQEQKQSNCWQLTPHGYDPSNMNILPGKVISSDEHYLITRDQQTIVVVHKISKKTIYWKWMSELVPSEPSFAHEVVRLLQ